MKINSFNFSTLSPKFEKDPIIFHQTPPVSSIQQSPPMAPYFRLNYTQNFNKQILLIYIIQFNIKFEILKISNSVLELKTGKNYTGED